MILKPNRLKTVMKPYYELHTAFIKDNPSSAISYGKFVSLKPFYVRHTSTKDLVMCRCKVHVHARWSIRAMIALLKSQDIEFPVQNYNDMFTYLYQQCSKNDISYISWDCVDPCILCPDIANHWNELKAIALTCAGTHTTDFTEFQKQPVFDKTGKVILNKSGQRSRLNVWLL